MAIPLLTAFDWKLESATNAYFEAPMEQFEPMAPPPPPTQIINATMVQAWFDQYAGMCFYIDI